MLSPEGFDLHLDIYSGCALSGLRWRAHQYFPAGLEHGVFFEQQLDSDFTFKSLRFGDPRDGNIGGFRLTDEALLQDLERKPLFQFHSRGAENGSDRSCRTTLFPDDFPEVGLSNS
jgi:hypothetical protein